LKKLHRSCQRQSWNLDKLKNDDFVALEYRCNVDIALEDGNKDKQQELSSDRWKHFRDTMTAAASATLGKPMGTQPRKPWISQEMIDKMEERRQWKNVNTDEGRQKVQIFKQPAKKSN